MFRDIEKGDTGIITVNQLRDGFLNASFSSDKISEVLSEFNLLNESKVNFNEFLISTIDKTVALTDKNLNQAFLNFSDSLDNSNPEFITIESLTSYFK